MSTLPPNSVTIRSKRPYFYPPEERDQEGNIITPGVYSSLAVNANIVANGNTYSGDHFVELPETATDDEIKAAILAQYGVA